MHRHSAAHLAAQPLVCLCAWRLAACDDRRHGRLCVRSGPPNAALSGICRLCVYGGCRLLLHEAQPLVNACVAVRRCYMRHSRLCMCVWRFAAAATGGIAACVCVCGGLPPLLYAAHRVVIVCVAATLHASYLLADVPLFRGGPAAVA